jgi:hypothetical protein
MPEHEPLDIASQDTERAEKPEARSARTEGTTPSGLDTPTRASSANMRSNAAEAASEPMDLQRLPESNDPPPPGRQRTGDPPAPSRSKQ